MNFKMRVLVCGVVLSTSLVSAVCGSPTSGPDTVRVLGSSKVALWMPTAGSVPHPLVLFSHGLWGCKEQSGGLLRALAENGMIVAAVDHADHLCSASAGKMPQEFSRSSWDDTVFQNRRDDMWQLRTDVIAGLGVEVDPSRVALMGHSLGGYTVLSLAGAHDSWKMEGLKAVVALAPYMEKYHSLAVSSGINIPVLIEIGDADSIAGKSYTQVESKFKSLSCVVIYTGAGHFAWVDAEILPELAQPQFAKSTSEIVVAFLSDLFDGRTPKTSPLTPQMTTSTCK